MSTLVEIMNEEHKIRNKCHSFMIAKKPFVNPRMCLILRKNSPYTHDINRGYNFRLLISLNVEKFILSKFLKY